MIKGASPTHYQFLLLISKNWIANLFDISLVTGFATGKLAGFRASSHRIDYFRLIPQHGPFEALVIYYRSAILLTRRAAYSVPSHLARFHER
jgi:hypothetical protein